MIAVRLLGPVQIFSGQDFVDCGPARQRCVLAALAVDAGRPVPIPTLIDRVWDESPPQRAQHALQVYLSRIRGVLAEAGTEAEAGSGASAGISRRSGGYALELGGGRLDLAGVRAALALAARPGITPDVRGDALERALRLWEGLPLADLQGRWVDQARQQWRQLRLETLIRWAGARLESGRADEVIGALSGAIADFPLAEPLRAAQMRALVAAHRRAEALAAYESARAHLAEELGVDPGPELTVLHRDILRGQVPAPAAV